MKPPPLEQRKKRGFCKFHGFLGHNLSRCTPFRDYVQKALDEGRLKFGEKTKQPMQVDVDPFKKVDSMYAEVIGLIMVYIANEFDSELAIKAQLSKKIHKLMLRWLLRTINLRMQ
ncbi:hypothetical protein MTR_1611s0010, partial [Medicago truncatula]